MKRHAAQCLWSLLNNCRFLFCSVASVSPVLADEDDGVAVGREAVAREVDIVADALRAVAVVAYAVEATRRVAAQACRVDGGGDVTGASECGLNGGGNLVHPDDVDHVVRTPGDGGDAVAATVDVDDDTILGDGVGAGEEVVHVHRVKVALAFLLVGNSLVTVNDFVVAAVDEFASQSHLADGLRATPGDAASLRHK